MHMILFAALALAAPPPHSFGDGFTFLSPLVAGQPAGAFDGSLQPSVTVQQVRPDTLAPVDAPRALAVHPGDDAYIANWHVGDLKPPAGSLWRIELALDGRTLGWVDVLIAGRTPPPMPAGESWVELSARGDYPVRFFLNGCAAVTCTASDTCHTAGSCDPATLACSNPAAPDGSACEDLCVTGGACQAGVCGGGAAKSCATDVCATAPAACEPSTGACVDGPDGCLAVTQDLVDDVDVAIWDYYGTVSAWWWTYEGYMTFDPSLGTLRKVVVDQTLTMEMGDGPGPDTCSQRTIFFGPGLWTGDSWDCSPNTTYEKHYRYVVDAPGDWVTPSSYYPEGRAITTPFHYHDVIHLTYYYWPK